MGSKVTPKFIQADTEILVSSFPPTTMDGEYVGYEQLGLTLEKNLWVGGK